MPVKAIKMVGRRFGFYVVKEQAGKTTSGEIIYLCECDCGREKEVRGGHLRKGLIISCGSCSKRKVS